MSLRYNIRMRIGIDMDDVVADSMDAIIRMNNEKYGTSLKKENIWSYHFRDVIGITREEELKRLEAVFAEDQRVTLRPMEGAIEAITALKHAGHELYVVTARPLTDALQTERWLDHRFPKAFAGVHYANLNEVDGVIVRKKSAVCKELGIELMIDDNMKNALDCASAGIRVFLFDQPWNKGELYAGVARVHSWEEIVKKIAA